MPFMDLISFVEPAFFNVVSVEIFYSDLLSFRFIVKKAIFGLGEPGWAWVNLGGPGCARVNQVFSQKLDP